MIACQMGESDGLAVQISGHAGGDKRQPTNSIQKQKNLASFQSEREDIAVSESDRALQGGMEKARRGGLKSILSK